MTRLLRHARQVRQFTVPILLLTLTATAQTPTITAVEFHFERPGLTTPIWSLLITSERTGIYSENETANPQQITISPSTWDKLIVPSDTVQSQHCETKLKNIAKTGQKTLGYKSASGEVHCEFNYSDDDRLNDTANTLQAIAETIQTGQKLAHDHRFDRLSLDADMETLEEEAKAGRAIELQNIGPVLNDIVSDQRVIDRARRRATRLLEASKQ